MAYATSNASSQQQNNNPLAPNSVPALLAEEYLINPSSAFPSFLEIMMIQEAEDTLATTLLTKVPDVSLHYLTNLSRRLLDWSISLQGGILNDAKRKMYQTTARFLMIVVSYRIEIILLLRYTLERRSISANSATITESMYGCKRQTVVGSDGKLQDLSTKDKTRLALWLVFGTYWKRKLESCCSRWKHRPFIHSNSQKSAWARILLQRCFVCVWPAISTACHAGTLLYQWRYMLRMAYYPDLKSKMLNQVVRRVTQSDMLESSNPTSNLTNSSGSDAASKSSDGSKRNEMMGDRGSRLRSAVYTAAFAAAAVSWLSHIRKYYQQEIVADERQQRIDSVIPPPVPSSSDTTIHNNTNFRGCGLCGQSSCFLPTVCVTTGHVYCNACIVAYVRQHSTCHVSGRRIGNSVKQLVRLYEPGQQQREERIEEQSILS